MDKILKRINFQLIAGGLLLGFLASLLVCFGREDYLFLILFLLLYLFSFSTGTKFFILSLVIFYPFYISNFGQFEDVFLFEILGPALAFCFGLELLLKREEFFSKKASIFLVAIFILILCVVVDFVLFPVFGMTFSGGGSENKGLREYCYLLVGVMIFFCGFWFLKYKEFSVNKWLWVLMFFSLGLSLLITWAYINKVSITFLGGLYQYFVPEGQYYRIGCLTEVAILGITALLCLVYQKKMEAVSAFFLFAAFIFFVFISGGRAVFFSLILTFLIYVLLVNRKWFFYLVIFSLLFITFLLLLNPGSFLGIQKKRLFSTEKNFLILNVYRYYTYVNFLKIFENYPFTGKGIRDFPVLEAPPNEEVKQFVETQMRSGGHGAYMSMLAIFGIGGIFFLLLMLIGGFYYSYIVFRHSQFFDHKTLALFVFLSLVNTSIYFGLFSRGWDYFPFWFLTGMAAGLRARETL